MKGTKRGTTIAFAGYRKGRCLMILKAPPKPGQRQEPDSKPFDWSRLPRWYR